MGKTTNKKSVKPSDPMEIQGSEVSSTTSESSSSVAASNVPNPLRASLRIKIAKKALERSRKRKAAVVKKATKRVRFQDPIDEPTAGTPRRSSRIIQKKDPSGERVSAANASGNGTPASDQPQKKAPNKSLAKKNSAIEKRSNVTSSSSSAARRSNQRVSKASGSRAKPRAAARKKKRVTVTQANTPARDIANVANANAAQPQNVEVANEAVQARVVAGERDTPPLHIHWESVADEEAPVVEVFGEDDADEFADLPDLVPFDHEDPVVIEQLPSPAEEDLEVVFIGVPDEPAKRWVTAETDAGDKVIEFYNQEYGEGEMPVANTVEEAADCIEMVRRIEIVNQEDQHIHDFVHGIKQLGLQYCPLFLYNKLVRKWVKEQREYMKIRKYKMRRMARYVNKGKHEEMRILNIKKFSERTNVSEFKTAAFKQTLRFFGEDDSEKTEKKYTLPHVETEDEAFECVMYMFHRELQLISGRTAIDFLEQFRFHPYSTWLKLYSALRPLSILKEDFQARQFQQTRNTYMYLWKKKYQASLREARVKVGLRPKSSREVESDDEDVDTRDHVAARDKIAKKLGAFRAKHNLPRNNLRRRVLP